MGYMAGVQALSKEQVANHRCQCVGGDHRMAIGHSVPFKSGGNPKPCLVLALSDDLFGAAPRTEEPPRTKSMLGPLGCKFKLQMATICALGPDRPRYFYSGVEMVCNCFREVPVT